MLLGAELYHQQAARLEEAGIPVPAQADLQNDAAAERTSVMHRAAKDLPRPARETMDLQQKMQQVRIIASAKRLMQEQLGWEEERAHRYLQKRAMDQCCTKIRSSSLYHSETEKRRNIMDKIYFCERRRRLRDWAKASRPLRWAGC